MQNGTRARGPAWGGEPWGSRWAQQQVGVVGPSVKCACARAKARSCPRGHVGSHGGTSGGVYWELNQGWWQTKRNV